MQCRDGLIGVLTSLGIDAGEMEPQELIALVDDLTSPTTAPQEDRIEYNPLDDIASQAIRRDIELEAHDDRMILRTERFREIGTRMR